MNSPTHLARQRSSNFFRVLARSLGAALFILAAPVLCAAETMPAQMPTSWHAQTLWQAIGLMVLWVFAGVAAAIGGYKLFDKCTPGDMQKEILENKNIAAAIVAAAVILGVCIIVAAAILG